MTIRRCTVKSSKRSTSSKDVFLCFSIHLLIVVSSEKYHHPRLRECSLHSGGLVSGLPSAFLRAGGDRLRRGSQVCSKVCRMTRRVHERSSGRPSVSFCRISVRLYHTHHTYAAPYGTVGCVSEFLSFIVHRFVRLHMCGNTSQSHLWSFCVISHTSCG